MNSAASHTNASATREVTSLAAATLRAPATLAIVALTAATSAALWALAALSPHWGPRVDLWLWNDPRLVTEHLWLWQVLTANLVHRGVVHLALNLFLVAWLGPRLEAEVGSLRFAGFYAAAGVVSTGLFDLWSLVSHAGWRSGGASGAALAVATLYAVRFPTRDIHLYGFIRVRFWWIVALFVLSDLSSLLLSGETPWVNSVAHLGGVAFGAACGLALRRSRTGV